MWLMSEKEYKAKGREAVDQSRGKSQTLQFPG